MLTQNSKAEAIKNRRSELDTSVPYCKQEIHIAIKQYYYECWLREMNLPHDILNLALTGDADLFFPGETWEYVLGHIPFEDRYFARLILGFDAPSRWVTCLVKRIRRYSWMVK